MSFTLDPTATVDWSAEVEALVAPYRNAQIEITNPATGTVDAPYNPVNDSGGVRTNPIIWGPVAARIRRVASTENLRAVDEWGVRGQYEFDIALNPAMPPLYRGYRIKVTSVGKGVGLDNFTYLIQTAGNSSYTNQMTILAISEEGPIS
jgi:hypothetical protein